MGFSTPAGKDLATNVWCVLDAAGLDGLDEESEPDSSRDRSGYRLAGHGDKVEVFYEAADELFAPSHEDVAGRPDRPEHQRLLFRRRIETVMLGAIAEILMAAGFGFTFHPACDQRAALLLVCSRSTPGIY
ncbi:hypothetical protein OG339_39255 [Streptosporangium sp. NBC_01495]|uniref:hypothetical protein n=1 Tax=Streptosporangium sp. NBC_01495 TaxID=2903899 RepID=UPI002E381C82|nr:hypothetical protein [Streptosporangium sp. NBC_01495]